MFSTVSDTTAPTSVASEAAHTPRETFGGRDRDGTRPNPGIITPIELGAATTEESAAAQRARADAPAGLRSVATRLSPEPRQQQQQAARSLDEPTGSMREPRLTSWSTRVSSWLSKQASRTGPQAEQTLPCVEYPLQTCSSPLHDAHTPIFDTPLVFAPGNSHHSSASSATATDADHPRLRRVSGHAASNPAGDYAVSDENAGGKVFAPPSAFMPIGTGGRARSGVLHENHTLREAGSTVLVPGCGLQNWGDGSLMKRNTGLQPGNADLGTNSIVSGSSMMGPPFLPMPPPMSADGELDVSAMDSGLSPIQAHAQTLRDASVHELGPSAC